VALRVDERVRRARRWGKWGKDMIGTGSLRVNGRRETTEPTNDNEKVDTMRQGIDASSAGKIAGFDCQMGCPN